MILCSDNHEEVCYDGRSCPVCDARDALQQEVDDLTQELEEAREEIDRLEAEADAKT
jgi:hypothetical protein